MRGLPHRVWHTTFPAGHVGEGGMTKWAWKLGLIGWCVLCSTGCGRRAPGMPEPRASAPAASAPSAPEPSPSIQKVVATETPVPAAPAEQQPRRPARVTPHPAESATNPEVPSTQVVAADSETKERPAREKSTTILDDEDRIWLSEAAEAARAGNAKIPASRPTEHITIATGTVEGRVKRVHRRAIEVRDSEGNVYTLRIDRRSRGLRQGRHVPLQSIAEGTPVRASFDLMGGGESLARDIVLRR